MSLQTTTNINVDFYDKKYILINAKQYDDSSRWIAVTCYNNGDIMNISASKHTAYVRYKKADDYGVLNSCRINYKGEVLIELTEQMLAADGICYVDLIIVNKGSAIVNIDTGEIITIDNSAILSTMAFCINVYETAFDNSVIESSYEFNAINEMLKRNEADYKEVIQLARSYAIGDANDIRENEDFDNSKYYSKMSQSWAIGDLNGNTGVKDRNDEHTNNAEYYSRLAKSYSKGGLDGATHTRNNEDADNAEYYSRLAKSYAMGSFDGSTNTRDNEGAENAKTFMDNALNYAIISQRYAIGETDTVDGEDTDNSKYYYEQSLNNANNANESEMAAKRYAESSEENMNMAISNANIASESATAAANSASSASNSAINASNSANDALSNATSAMNSANDANISAVDADVSSQNAQTYMEQTKTYMENAKVSEINANKSETNAQVSAVNALNSETSANRYATSAQGSMTSAFDSAISASNSATDAQNYYLQTEAIVNGLNGAFLPMGTITYAKLTELKTNEMVAAGYLYNISDNFITDDTFKIGAGIEYEAGTNVYYTADGYWDCLAGTTVTGVKGNNEEFYRKGNVNITAENIGAIPTTDIASVDEIKNYLGI